MVNCYYFIIYSSIDGRVCINNVTQLCHTTRVCASALTLVWKFCHTFVHLGISLMPKMVFISRGQSTALLRSFFRHSVPDPGSCRFMFIGVNIEFSSLFIQKKSHPPFLVGGCMWHFLQFKCTSCMVRTIS